MTSVKDIQTMLGSEDDSLIKELVNLFVEMENSRHWDAERDEVLNFLYATDTRNTVGASNTFSNTTTIPKVKHIYNNIKTSILSHLFPNSNWIQWAAGDSISNTKEVRQSITSFVKDRFNLSGALGEVHRCVDDYLQSGICIAVTYYGKESVSLGGVLDVDVPKYTGPMLRRIDPLKFYHDASANSMKEAAKALQEFYSYGDLKSISINGGEFSISEEQFNMIMMPRKQVSSLSTTQQSRLRQQLERAGFAGALDLMSTEKVEILTIFATIYDTTTDTLYENYKFVIADRHVLLEATPATTWHQEHGLHIAMYDTRDGVLSPVGPLHNIIGLQYKIDKLENLRADIFDWAAHPATKEKGEIRVVGKRGTPGCRYVLPDPDNGDITYMHPPLDVLQADNQIAFTLQLMEELSAAPRESVGQRTPGEKSVYEVQLLDNGQNKLFRYHVKDFERTFLSPILNDFLLIGRKNFGDSSINVPVRDQSLHYDKIVTMTVSNLTGNGKLHAIGASLAIERSNLLQALTAVMNGNIGQMILPHVSRTSLAHAVEELIQSDMYDIFKDNIGVQEDAETQALAQTAADAAQRQVSMSNSLLDDGVESVGGESDEPAQ